MKPRIVIDDVVLGFSNRIHSHKSAWPRMQRCLADDFVRNSSPPADDVLNVAAIGWTDRPELALTAATWFVSHSMEFNGEVYNLFGGWSHEVEDRVRRLIDFEGQVYSLERRMPDLEAILRPRATKAPQGCDFTEADWRKLEEACHVMQTLSHADLLVASGRDPYADVVLGDSHALAHYKSGRLVLRNDGLTLHRLLADGIGTQLPHTSVGHLTIAAGNIDIRHHLLRLPDWRRAVEALVSDLKLQLTNLVWEGRIDTFTVAEPYPIEFEGRRIPKTGWYKGTPFYGSQFERSLARGHFASCLFEAFGDGVFRWPTKWFELDPEDYAESYMERPGSVHLSPAWHVWDYARNVPNVTLSKEYT